MSLSSAEYQELKSILLTLDHRINNIERRVVELENKEEEHNTHHNAQHQNHSQPRKRGAHRKVEITPITTKDTHSVPSSTASSPQAPGKWAHDRHRHGLVYSKRELLDIRHHLSRLGQLIAPVTRLMGEPIPVRETSVDEESKAEPVGPLPAVAPAYSVEATREAVGPLPALKPVPTDEGQAELVAPLAAAVAPAQAEEETMEHTSLLPTVKPAYPIQGTREAAGPLPALRPVTSDEVKLPDTAHKEPAKVSHNLLIEEEESEENSE